MDQTAHGFSTKFPICVWLMDQTQHPIITPSWIRTNENVTIFRTTKPSVFKVQEPLSSSMSRILGRDLSKVCISGTPKRMWEDEVEEDPCSSREALGLTDGGRSEGDREGLGGKDVKEVKSRGRGVGGKEGFKRGVSAQHLSQIISAGIRHNVYLRSTPHPVTVTNEGL